jgi:hypothetical protein
MPGREEAEGDGAGQGRQFLPSQYRSVHSGGDGRRSLDHALTRYVAYMAAFFVVCVCVESLFQNQIR